LTGQVSHRAARILHLEAGDLAVQRGETPWIGSGITNLDPVLKFVLCVRKTIGFLQRVTIETSKGIELDSPVRQILTCVHHATPIPNQRHNLYPPKNSNYGEIGNLHRVTEQFYDRI